MKKVTGVMFYYYYVCKRKLWLFTNQISLEEENPNVILGKLLDESAYPKEHKHLLIDDTINIDFLKNWKVLHEVKKSKKIEEASIWQIKYYLYFLKNKGINIEKGVLDYPKLREIKEIFLEEDDVIEIEKVLSDIQSILSEDIPPEFIKKKICKECAYFDYCLV